MSDTFPHSQHLGCWAGEVTSMNQWASGKVMCDSSKLKHAHSDVSWCYLLPALMLWWEPVHPEGRESHSLGLSARAEWVSPLQKPTLAQIKLMKLAFSWQHELFKLTFEIIWFVCSFSLVLVLFNISFRGIQFQHAEFQLKGYSKIMCMQVL